MKKILLEAYHSNDPMGQLLKIKVTQDLLNTLIPPDTIIDSKEPEDVYMDLVNYLKTKDKEWSNESLVCKFAYFATSMVHIFEKFATVYIQNKRLPYVCINVSSDSSVKIMHFCDLLKVRITLHIVKSPKDIKMVKRFYDLEEGIEMPFSNGNSVQLALRLDLNTVHFTSPCVGSDFVTIVYFDGMFIGTFYKTRIISIKH